MVWGHVEIPRKLWNISIANSQSMGPISCTGDLVQISSSSRSWGPRSQKLAVASLAWKSVFYQMPTHLGAF